MSEYNLTLDDLEVGKNYKRKSEVGSVSFCLNKNGRVISSYQALVIIVKGDRFKLIEEPEQLYQVMYRDVGQDAVGITKHLYEGVDHFHRRNKGGFIIIGLKPIDMDEWSEL